MARHARRLTALAVVGVIAAACGKPASDGGKTALGFLENGGCTFHLGSLLTVRIGDEPPPTTVWVGLHRVAAPE